MNWKSALLVLTIFALGAAAGVLVTLKLTRDQVADARNVAGLTQEKRNILLAGDLKRSVNLTPDQVKKVDEVLQQWIDESRKIRETGNRLIPRILREIVPTLSPEQRESLDRFRKKRLQRAQRAA